LVGVGSTSTTLEKDGDNQVGVGHLFVVEQLQFKIKSPSADQVLAGGVENKSGQMVVQAVVHESLGLGGVE